MTNLPVLNYPICNITIPSLKTSCKFRPFLVKEEKLLLMARESGNAADILVTIKQIINNCMISSKIDLDKLTIFDIEYIFIKLRAVSVDNKVKVAYKDNEDEKIYDFEINLEEIQVKFPENIDNIIKITKETGIIMKYPSASLYNDSEFLSLEKDYMFELIIRCIDKIYDQEEIYEAKDYKREQLSEFLENLNIKTFESIQKFLLDAPKLEYKITYTNSMNNNREIILSSLNDFFTWR